MLYTELVPGVARPLLDGNVRRKLSAGILRWSQQVSYSFLIPRNSQRGSNTLLRHESRRYESKEFLPRVQYTDREIHIESDRRLLTRVGFRRQSKGYRLLISYVGYVSFSVSRVYRRRGRTSGHAVFVARTVVVTGCCCHKRRRVA